MTVRGGTMTVALVLTVVATTVLIGCARVESSDADVVSSTTVEPAAVVSSSGVPDRAWDFCRSTISAQREQERISRTIEWEYASDVWPADLLDAAQVFIAGNSGSDAMTLSDPEYADQADGTRWAIFMVWPTNIAGYEGAVVVMRRDVDDPWVGITLGTGIARADVLPQELLATDFGMTYLEDQ